MALPQSELEREEKITAPVALQQPLLTVHHGRTPARVVCKWVGVLLIAVGLYGFMSPMLEAQQRGAHNFIHIIAGVLSFAAARLPAARSVRAFSVSAGAFFLAIGVVGFALAENASGLWVLVPGVIEFGIHDQWIHLLSGAAWMGSGLIGLKKGV